MNRKPPYGHKLISQARSIPQFELALVSKNETSSSGTGVQVDLTVDLRLKQSKPLPVTKRGGVKFWATVATTTSDNEFIECAIRSCIFERTSVLTRVSLQLSPRSPRSAPESAEAV